MKVYGEAVVAKFAKKHPASRKPLQRSLGIVRAANWPHFPAVKQSFSAAGYAPSTGTLIFDIGGNKYRLIAFVNFETQAIVIDRALTHEEYNREDL
jgi:mRNA interferase HigB